MSFEAYLKKMWADAIGYDTDGKVLKDKGVYRILFEIEPGVRVTTMAVFDSIPILFRVKTGAKRFALPREHIEVLSGRLA